jgi:adenylate kinase
MSNGLVFVNDATGHVGSAVVEKLLEADYEVCGTIVEGGRGSTKGLKSSVSIADAEGTNALIMSADALVFAAEGHMAATKSMLRLLKRGGYEGEKKLIVISSLMTWGNSKLPEEGGLLEENFNTRKAPARYNELKTLESQVKAVARENLATTVIGAGILYGGGENVLHPLFRMAWMDENCKLPVLAGKMKGANIIPTIDVNDLASITVASIAETPESPYVVAVDKSQSSLREIVQAISTAVGSGKIEDLTREQTQAILMKEPGMTSLNSHLTFSLDGGAVEKMGFEWKSEDGLIVNIDSVVEDYKRSRDLRPVRVIVMGPPHGAGLKERAEELAKSYYVPLITPRSAIALALVSPPEPTEGDEAPEDPNAELREAVAAAAGADGAGEIKDTALLCQVIRLAMNSRACKNKGWVLGAGLPTSWAEAVGLFSAEGPEAAAEDAEAGEGDDAYRPSGVVVFEGSDEYLKGVVMKLPEGEGPTEAALTSALESYRAAMSAENVKSPISFFESVYKMDSITIQLEDGGDVASTIADYVEQGSKPFNYHPTPEEVTAAQAVAEKESKEKEAKELAAKESRDAAEKAEREVAQKEEQDRLEEIKRQETELLEARSLPLRRYLMKNVIPSLTEGLLETCKVMPEDPIDYLAEYLFRVSPAIDASKQEKKK